MWRYVAGVAAGVLLVAAGMMVQAGRTSGSQPLAAMPNANAAPESVAGGAVVPEALPATREARRFARYDKDQNGAVTKDEYLAARRKAFAKLDRDGNGALSFDEWAAKAEAKFSTADRDHSGTMNAAEFATTAAKRNPRSRTVCPPTRSAPTAPDDSQNDDS